MAATWTFTTAGLVFRVYGSGDSAYWTMGKEGAEETETILRFEGSVDARTAIFIATAYRLGRDAEVAAGVVRERKTWKTGYDSGYEDGKASERAVLRQRLGLDDPSA